MARIELDDVSLTFHVRPLGRLTLKEFLVRRMFRPSVNRKIKVRALRNVSLQLKEGERIGILGANGAGKSTLLKVLAGIYPLSHGRRTVEGKISSLFDISLGFEPEANGWDNIAYRSYLQGATPQEVRSRLKAIADFSELGEHLDMPVRYYSSGMMVRLAFAVATSIEPEILLVDEVLSVGDMAFQQKAKARMRQMMEHAQIIVLASHDLGSLAQFCSRAIWMDRGHVRQIGPAEAVIAAYSASVNQVPPSHSPPMNSSPALALCA
jgi:lipopolysaccharide transport system ATP-binding protein